jgi:manganese/zinc/iron transport system permease protein
MDELLQKRDFTLAQLKNGLKMLKKQGFVRHHDSLWQLTSEGLEKGKRTQRLHRLWELYLTEYLRIAPDHVHENAESIEHILTPEMEKKLEKILNFPTTDPHQTIIPPKTM